MAANDSLGMQYDDDRSPMQRYLHAASRASTLCGYCLKINGECAGTYCPLARTLEQLYGESGREKRVDYIELGQPD